MPRTRHLLAASALLFVASCGGSDESGAGEDADAFDGAPGARITIDGAVYDIAAESCVITDGAVSVTGVGTGPSGVDAWGNIDVTTSTRAELAEHEVLGDPETLESIFGDRDAIVDLTVELAPDQTSGFGPDDKPKYVYQEVLGTVFFGEATYSIENGTISGGGEIVDEHGVATGFGVTVPFSFVAACG